MLCIRYSIFIFLMKMLCFSITLYLDAIEAEEFGYPHQYYKRTVGVCVSCTASGMLMWINMNKKKRTNENAGLQFLRSNKVDVGLCS